MIRAGATAGLVALIAVVGAAPATGAQQQNANAWAYWAWRTQVNGAIWDVGQDIAVRRKARSTFWAAPFDWSDGSAGGYMGVQTNAMSFHGVGGNAALFSINGSVDARGPHCGHFAPEPGALQRGFSCRISYNVIAGRWYRLRLWRLAPTGRGWWWTAYIQDTATGRDTRIGDLLAPPTAVGVGAWNNFTEYFGSPVRSKDRVPQSVADYTQPAANARGGGLYDSVGRLSGSTVGAGTTGEVAEGEITDADGSSTRAARITMGG